MFAAAAVGGQAVIGKGVQGWPYGADGLGGYAFPSASEAQPFLGGGFDVHLAGVQE